MILLVGLGNPGSDYARNRHNIGFMAADVIVRRHSFGPWRAKFQGEVAEGVIEGRKVIALKPQTYMNLSGQSVAAASRFLKVPVDDIVVLHDELDIAPGRLKVKRGGGAGGHNGLKSIDSHLGQNYRRVRMGIGHPGDRDLVSGYVLHDFAKADEAWLIPVLDAVADTFPMLVSGDDTGFMTRVAHLTAPPKPKKEKPAAEAAPASAPASVSPPPSAGSLAEALKAAMIKITRKD
ncbi:Peptidyl-tRNA hydrolase [Paramagnetospirillum magnetotacticum MS-1]|uniref:Peptidyl-tRNA hydrolase n=1 Tax=Paramagnetospirillum magnetotacticum MS-1 TaxID=272627 RepID=A0A0C2YTK9_PARME|nr:aminoacyl-tRNA hydrolase [Paramagnetospirillum magnetotacticum]KIL98030.1 Peptidyl-tRNA hydrolase [Paramagnetospirillum magnetotacticum MS-1]